MPPADGVRVLLAGGTTFIFTNQIGLLLCAVVGRGAHLYSNEGFGSVAHHHDLKDPTFLPTFVAFGPV